MLFNSYPFLFIYLPIVLAGFFTFSKLKWIQAAKIWLLLSSLFFYAYWDINYLPLLLCSILFNYAFGFFISNGSTEKIQKIYLTIGITGNTSLLFYYKYSYFFLSFLKNDFSNYNDLILPLGISFFTFTQIAYLIDIYKKVTTGSNIISYSLFVTVFPHLIAGPILHNKDMIGQFNHTRMFQFSYSLISQGIFLFTVGLFKKVVIADSLSHFVKHIFDETEASLTLIEAWFGAISYTLQLYFDFSGYSDMAVGLGLLFGLRLPINFNSPYQADSIIDFWRRWHITLSLFLKDYLYFPLGGNRNGRLMKLRNLMITMVLGGIWHGAGLTFILWGVLHGTFLVINHIWRDLKLSMPHWIARILTLTAVICAWVVFRSQSIEQATNILTGMFGFHGIILPEKYANSLSALKHIGVSFGSLTDANFRFLDVLFVLILFVLTLFVPNSQYWLEKFKNKPVFYALPCATIFVTGLLYMDEMAEFLYYQF